ncbi:MAG TPA: GerMN domain-containing protein [Candidatus Gastranaerophilales bacterium]|nr:GerMN domain-containing protein [Candidatus Gastranaerophilales bacterium]
MKNKKTIIIAVVLAIITSLIILFIINYSQNNRENLVDKNSALIYFVRENNNNFELISRKRKKSNRESALRTALKELLKGPASNELDLGYFTEIPKETKIIEIKETSDRVIINLSRDFEKDGGSASMELRLKQVINTALDSVDKKPVYLELEGKELKYLGGEGIIVPQPLSRNLNKGQNL